MEIFANFRISVELNRRKSWIPFRFNGIEIGGNSVNWNGSNTHTKNEWKMNARYESKACVHVTLTTPTQNPHMVECDDDEQSNSLDTIFFRSEIER